MIYNSLPIFFDNDVPHEGSKIYLTLILTLLKVRRAVILLLEKILRGLLFENLVQCVIVYGRTPKLLEIFA